MKTPSNDPSIFHEPHLRGADVPPEPKERPLGMSAQAPEFSKYSEEDIDHSVWDEPSVGRLAGDPESGALTYANWLAGHQSEWSQGKAWAAAGVIALLAGPWGLIGTVIGSVGSNAGGLLVLCVIVPMVQEICKIAIPLWVVEKRPYVFTAWFQLFLCAIVSATIFATVYNFVNQALMPHSPTMFILNWTGFLLMHVVASTLAATGLEKIWRITLATGKPPKLEHGFKWFVMAIGLNVAYTTCITLYRVALTTIEQLSS